MSTINASSTGYCQSITNVAMSAKTNVTAFAVKIAAVASRAWTNLSILFNMAKNQIMNLPRETKILSMVGLGLSAVATFVFTRCIGQQTPAADAAATTDAAT